MVQASRSALWAIRLHPADFFLPNLMNIRIHVNQEQWTEFQQVQAQVMAAEVLVPYANAIQALASEVAKP